MVEVSDGYGKNFILKKKLGVEATNANMNDLKLQKAQEEKRAREQLEAAQNLAKELEEKSVVIPMKAGEGDGRSAPCPPRRSRPPIKNSAVWRSIKRRSSCPKRSKPSVPMKSP